MYFQSENPNQPNNKEDKGLLSPEQLRENAQKKAQKIEQSKTSGGLLQKNEGRLLTNDGREIFNENK
jgi:ribosomal protein S19E (S16A)